jgi:hypothetical protein
MPKDSMYTPIQVGKKNSPDLGYLGDDKGDNISSKNPNYCELTAMYWAWKNLNADFIGLVHYRRHFSNKALFVRTTKNKWSNILIHEKAEKIFQNHDAILPKKRHYWIETSKSHYEHAHNVTDLQKAGEIIKKKYPEYYPIFIRSMQKTASHRFNMFIMKKSLFDAYSKWLFDILFQLEKEISITKYSLKEARVFGYISERLLDVWIDKNKVNYVEEPVMFMEKQNWYKKIYLFLKRKYLTSLRKE